MRRWWTWQEFQHKSQWSKNLPMLELNVLHTWGNIIRVFEPFISFLSITWTWPTLQLLNKALLEVILIESMHLALIIFTLGLRREISQDYQAPLANIFKRQISQILKWPKFFSQPQTLTLFASNQKVTLKITKFPDSQKIFKLGIFLFLACSQHMWFPSLTFFFFNCLWKLNLKFFKNEEANLFTCF